MSIDSEGQKWGLFFFGMGWNQFLNKTKKGRTREFLKEQLAKKMLRFGEIFLIHLIPTWSLTLNLRQKKSTHIQLLISPFNVADITFELRDFDGSKILFLIPNISRKNDKSPSFWLFNVGQKTFLASFCLRCKMFAKFQFFPLRLNLIFNIAHGVLFDDSKMSCAMFIKNYFSSPLASSILVSTIERPLKI